LKLTMRLSAALDLNVDALRGAAGPEDVEIVDYH
jgi:hypothetical protein